VVRAAGETASWMNCVAPRGAPVFGTSSDSRRPIAHSGNRRLLACDSDIVDCECCCEVVSADLDREATAEESQAAEQHLDRCAACRSWADRAAAVTRRTRTGPADTAPDLVALVLEARDHGWPPLRSTDLTETPGPASSSAGPARHLTLVIETRAPAPRTSRCGCLATCGCGCQRGLPCRCSRAA
jgi:hypothetical protein